MELHKRRRGVTEPEARYFTAHVSVASIHADTENRSVCGCYWTNRVAMKRGPMILLYEKRGLVGTRCSAIHSRTEDYPS